MSSQKTKAQRREGHRNLHRATEHSFPSCLLLKIRIQRRARQAKLGGKSEAKPSISGVSDLTRDKPHSRPRPLQFKCYTFDKGS